MATLDPRQLGALRKTINHPGPITFPTPTAGETYTAIIRSLSVMALLHGVKLKNDTKGDVHYDNIELAPGVELIGVKEAYVATGPVEVFFTTGA